MDAEIIHRRRWAILAILSLSVFLVVVDNTIVNIALPTLSRDLGASTSQLQWIVDAYSLVFAGLLLAFGSLGDRFGRKGALQLGLISFGITSVFAAFANSAGQLIAARVGDGHRRRARSSPPRWRSSSTSSPIRVNERRPSGCGPVCPASPWHSAQ